MQVTMGDRAGAAASGTSVVRIREKVPAAVQGQGGRLAAQDSEALSQTGARYGGTTLEQAGLAYKAST
ncbi:hypothetical protein BV508_00120 [Mycobacterium intermedium]|nr:hypothetical protein BV508_00120 [Mycobacterium intermedium]